MLPTPEDASQMTGDQVVAVLREAVRAERAACQAIAQQAADRWRPAVLGLVALEGDDVAAALDGVAAAIGARQDGTP